MAKNKTSRGPGRKELRALISGKLQNTLKDLAPLIGEKKYQKRIKKASKILTTKIKTQKGVGWDNLELLPAQEMNDEVAVAK